MPQDWFNLLRKNEAGKLDGPQSEAVRALIGYFGEDGTPTQNAEGWRLTICSEKEYRHVFSDGSSKVSVRGRIGNHYVCDADETSQALAEIGVTITPKT